MKLYTWTLFVNWMTHLKEYFALYRANHPIAFWLVVGVNVVIFVVILYGNLRMHHVRPIAKFLRVLHIILVFIVALLVFFATLAFDYVNLPKSVYSCNQFSVEVIILTIIDQIIFWVAVSKGKYDDMIEVRQDLPNAKTYDYHEEEQSELWEKKIYRPVFLIIVSLLFIFTGLRHTLPGFGFHFFGKTIGKWIYNLYYSLSLALFFDIVNDAVTGIISYIQAKTGKAIGMNFK